MAMRQTVTITSDLSGDEGASPFSFGLDGVQFEIDLTEKEAADLRNVFANYTANARKVSGKTSGRKASTSTSTKRDDLDKIREFAKANNIEVASRGRIAQSVIDQYDVQKSV